jgi:hypothetical protein
MPIGRAYRSEVTDSLSSSALTQVATAAVTVPNPLIPSKNVQNIGFPILAERSLAVWGKSAAILGTVSSLGADAYAVGGICLGAGDAIRGTNSGSGIGVKGTSAGIGVYGKGSPAGKFVGTLEVTGDIKAATERGVILNAANKPLITRGFDPFGQTQPLLAGKESLKGLGRWGLFIEPHNLVIGIPDPSGGLGSKSFEVAKYNEDGSRQSLMKVDNSSKVTIGNGSEGELHVKNLGQKAVYGESFWGVEGYSGSGSGTGVYGHAPFGTGVHAEGKPALVVQETMVLKGRTGHPSASEREEGMLYYNKTNHKAYIWDGSDWKALW